MSQPQASPLLSLDQYRRQVDKALTGIFDEAVARAETIDPVYAQLLTVTRDSLLRSGKRLRPYLTYLAFHGAGDGGEILGVAASVELIHHYLLIHDDIIDRDLERHGGPNVIGVYYQQFRANPISDEQARHYAESYALLAGNACSTLALQAISGSNFSQPRKLAALEAVHSMLFEEMGGQLTDVSVAIPGYPPASLDQLIRVARYKTAAYSFIAPLQLGAIMAGSPATTRASFKQFGKSLGIAFQIADDLLGVYGDAATLGKPIHSDMREGKRTVLIHYALAAATPAQARQLGRVWGGSAAGAKELEQVKDLLEATGARTQVEALAEHHLQAALAALDPAGLDPHVRDRLVELAHFCVKRRY